MSKFEKGVSGNPAGRPKGSRDKRRLYREMIEAHTEDLIRKAIDIALGGDESMIRFLLDRLLPSKPKDDPLPEMKLEGSPSEQSAQIISLVCDGIITPMEGNSFLDSMIAHLNITTVDDIAKRLERIEKKEGFVK